MTPLVSIIIPCYNQARFLEESVGSALAQTWLNIEVIVVDDGSTDPESVAILDAFAMPGVRLIRQENKGRSGVRNAAIRAARGTYILPLDADDILEPEYAAEAVALMQNDPGLGIVTCGVRYFGFTEGVWELPPCGVENMLFENCIHISSLFLREDWEKTGGFDEGIGTIYEDYDFWLSILELGKRAVRIEKPLLRYRKHDAATTVDLKRREAGREREERLAALSHIYAKHAALYRAHARKVAPRLYTQLRASRPRHMDYKKRLYQAERALHGLLGRIPGLAGFSARRLARIERKLEHIALVEKQEKR